MNAVFTHEDFQALLARFSANIPGLLASSRHTADLVRQLDALNDAAESPFTVAVVGQMRAGKSTLLNALIGCDLAVTGVNETTATINWFKHADTAEDCARFQVTWKDAPAELLPLERLKDWIGDSESAKRTHSLAFFAQSDFLRTANIVDTPGTRSLIADHTEKLQDFLAAKCHEETVRQGGRADAIIYVLMPVARQTDESLLQEFEGKTRVPGSQPYNSLAVLHKWETMIDAKDPFKEANCKAEKVLAALKGRVSCVVPVSAPLAICAERLAQNTAFWEGLFRLGKASDAVIEDLTMTEEYYAKKDIPDSPMDAPEREALRQIARGCYPGLPWPSFKVMLLAAHDPTVASPAQLQAKVGEMSGMAKLKSELDKRYFARARAIKAFSVLGKAWNPCAVAQSRLRREKMLLDGRLHDTKNAITLLSTRIAAGDAALQPASECLRASTSILEAEFRQASELLRRIGDEVRDIQTAYEDMDSEIQVLEKLEACKTAFSQQELFVVQALLGVNGPEMSARLRGVVSDTKTPSLDELDQIIGTLRACACRMPIDARRVVDIAVLRAEAIADQTQRS